MPTPIRTLLVLLVAIAAARAARAQTSASPAPSDVTARVVGFGPSVTSEISTTLVVQFDNHAARAWTVTRYHVEWNGGHSRDATTSFVVPAHGSVQRRMHVDGNAPDDLATYRVPFEAR